MINILVTGAKGFVGRNLCASLQSIRDGKDKTSGAVVTGDILRIYNNDRVECKSYPVVVHGDVNGDGVINALDAAEILKSVVGLATVDAKVADYNADGTVRFDAMETKPAVGDTVTIYGIVGQYTGTAQVKNGWIVKIGE